MSAFQAGMGMWGLIKDTITHQVLHPCSTVRCVMGKSKTNQSQRHCLKSTLCPGVYIAHNTNSALNWNCSSNWLSDFPHTVFSLFSSYTVQVVHNSLWSHKRLFTTLYNFFFFFLNIYAVRDPRPVNTLWSIKLVECAFLFWLYLMHLGNFTHVRD